MSIIKVHNIETNEIIEREMNVQELAQVEIDKATAEAKAKTASAQAKLEALGLTADDLKALGL